MNLRTRYLPLLLLALAPACLAQGLPAPNGVTVVESGPGWGVATTTTVANAQVVAIDAGARRMDLQLADGRLIGLSVGREVRRLEEIQPGAVVNVAYVDSLMLELRKQGAPVVARTDSSGVRRGRSGEPPSAVKQSEVSVLADVIAVDPASRTVTLRGPAQTVNVRLNDPRQLELVKVGDQVEATYAEAVAVSVDPAR